MRTPEKAKTVEDLQTGTGLEDKKDFLVLTENSLKKIPFEQINKIFIRQRIGQISSWVCDAGNIKKWEMPLLGGVLKAADFEDNLEEIKTLCPDWVQDDGDVKLPNYDGYFMRMDISRSIGTTQEDSLENLNFKNKIFQVGNLVSYFAQPEGRGSNSNGLIVGSEDNSGTEVLSPISKSRFHFLSFWQAVQEYYRSDYNNLNVKCSIKTNLKPEFEKEPRMSEETRPKNFNVLYTVCVGVPKQVTEPKKFKFLNSEKTITLFKGSTGNYMGYSEEYMKEFTD